MTLPAQAVRIWKTAVYLAGGEFRQMFVISTPGREDVRLYDATAVLPQAQLIALDAGLPIHSEVIEFMGEAIR